MISKANHKSELGRRQRVGLGHEIRRELFRRDSLQLLFANRP